MPNYAQMYKVLFSSITQAIAILQKAQQATEQMYISSEDPFIQVLPRDCDSKDKDGDHHK